MLGNKSFTRSAGMNSSAEPGSVTRRDFLAASAAIPIMVQKDRQRPNILWICTDQQRFDTIHALGNSAIETPNLDRLVLSGVSFNNAYCQSPICTPSRASFLTGCYPSTLHVNRNGNAWFPKEAAERLISRILSDAGYDCGLAGKLHLSSCQNRPEARVNDGYRVFRWSHQPMPNPAWPIEAEAYHQWLTKQGVKWEHEFGKVKVPGWPEQFQAGIAAKYDQSTWCATEAISFLSEKRPSPWLMSVNMFSPHPILPPQPAEQKPAVATSPAASHPPANFFAPPELLERIRPENMPLPLYRESDMVTHRALAGVDHQTTAPLRPSDYPARHMVATYYASIEAIDRQVGRMLDALEATGQRENTIVIFTSDHGEMLGDHGLFAKGCRFYEGAVHVPLVISWPARFRSGVKSSGLVELTDIVPTLLEAAGLSLPAHVQGRSLLDIATGKADPAKHREFVRCEYHDAIRRPNGSHANMLCDGRWKIVVYHGARAGELYDLMEDRYEFRNLWDDRDYHEKKDELLHRVFDATMLATDPGQPRIASY